MERVKYGGKWIEFRKSIYDFNYFNKGTRCAICNEVISRKSNIFLAKFILPKKELVVHEECIQPPVPFDKNNPFVWAAGKLTERWKEAQKWEAWF